MGSNNQEGLQTYSHIRLHGLAIDPGYVFHQHHDPVATETLDIIIDIFLPSARKKKKERKEKEMKGRL